MANEFEELMAARRKPGNSKEEPLPPKSSEPTARTQPDAAPPKRGRGRPATGKRSDVGWIGRTYYVKEATDIDVEIELASLRRQGVNLDKSELTNALLAAWVAWRKGESANRCLSEISPRRNDD